MFQEIFYILIYSGEQDRQRAVSLCCSEEEMRRGQRGNEVQVGEDLGRGQKMEVRVVCNRNYKKNVLTVLERTCWRIMGEGGIEWREMD